MFERTPLLWPDGRHLALYVGLQIDPYDVEDRSVPASLSRMARLFDQLEIRPTALVNSEVCQRHREVLDMGAEGAWAWVVRGQDSLRRTFRSIELVTGDRPRGWLRFRDSLDTSGTLQRVSELGANYILEPSEDHLPRLCGHGGLLSLPYSYELDDSFISSATSTEAATFARRLIGQFEALYAASQDVARVMSISVHVPVTGRPFRYDYLAEALGYIAAHTGVWLATTDDIASHCAFAGRARPQPEVFEELPLG